MAGAINFLPSLNEYEVRGRAGSYEALGELFLSAKCVPQDRQAYFDLIALGEQYDECYYIRKRDPPVLKQRTGITMQ